MYIKVDHKNEKQLNQFNRIWVECWNEKGYELEFTSNSDKFIILNEEGQGIGTTEFIKYNIGKNACEEVYSYKDLDLIKNNIDQIVEIDKIALTNTFRGKNIEKILYLIYKYTKDNSILSGIGLMEPIFYKAMKLFYKIPITKLSKKKYYKGDWVIPVIIDTEYVHNNPQEFKWISKWDAITEEAEFDHVISK